MWLTQLILKIVDPNPSMVNAFWRKTKAGFFNKECKSAHDSYWVCAEDFEQREKLILVYKCTHRVLVRV